MSFSITTYQNEYLSEGATEMHAVIAVTSEGGEAVAGENEKAVVLVVDVSGSMENPSTKISAARSAAAAAIKLLPDGTLFALVVGDHEARCAYPSWDEGLVRADERTRAEAGKVARRLRVGGGTAISTWIDLVRRLVEPCPDAIRLAYLLTDGKNESEPASALETAISRAAGSFQCDTRGVGADWSVAELRRISSALLGEVGIIKSPEEMDADFRAFMDRAVGKNIAAVRLRAWTPAGSTVRFLRQVAPVIEDLTDAALTVNPLTCDYDTGAWAGQESRDYHLCVDLVPGEVGDEKLAARVSLVVGEGVAGQGLVRAVWTSDLERSTRLNEQVARYTDQDEAAKAIAEGLQARKDGDLATATVRLGRAVQLAAAAGNEDTLRLLRLVVDVDDEEHGTVRVKRSVDEVDEMELDVSSTRTVRVKRPAASATSEDAR